MKKLAQDIVALHGRGKRNPGFMESLLASRFSGFLFGAIVALLVWKFLFSLGFIPQKLMASTNTPEEENPKHIQQKPEVKPKEIVKRPAPTHKWQIFLTFDDGPVYGTDDILNDLNARNIKATFFLVGWNFDENMGFGRVSWNRQMLKGIEEGGHLAANHSFSHKYRYDQPEFMHGDFMNCQSQLEKLLGSSSSFARFKAARLPGSNVWHSADFLKDGVTWGFSTESTAVLLKNEGYQIFGWDLEWFGTKDDKLKNTPDEMAAKIRALLQKGLTMKAGKLVLLTHDKLFRASKSGKNQLGILIDDLSRDPDLGFYTLEDF